VLYRCDRAGCTVSSCCVEKMKINSHTFTSYLPVVLSLGLLFSGAEFALSILSIALLLLYLLIADRNETVKKIVIASFLLRVAVAFVDHYGYLTHYGWDEYFPIAMQIKHNLVRGYPLLANVTESIHGVAYGVFCSLIYYVFGDHQIIMRMVNCFLGSLVADRVYRISLRLSGDHASSALGAGITAFYPSFIIYCALDMRDAMIFFLTADMLYRISLLLHRKSGKDLALFALEVAALYFLRTQYLLLFTMVGLVYLFVRSNLFQSRLQRLTVFLLLLSLVWIGYQVLQQRDYFPVLFKYMNADLAYRTAGGSAYLVGVQYETWWDVIRWTPVRMIHFAFGPFLWTVRNVFMLLGSIESMLLLFIILAAFSKRARRLYSQNPKLYMVLFFFAVIGLLSSAMIDSNYGTALRHKMNFIFIFFIFGAATIQSIKIRFV